MKTNHMYWVVLLCAMSNVIFSYPVGKSFQKKHADAFSARAELLKQKKSHSLVKKPTLFNSVNNPSAFINRAPDSVFKIGFNFLAATQLDRLGTIAVPTNSTGDVGPEQYILCTYGLIRSFNKKTGQPDNILDIDAFSFFADAPNDVRILYNRFFDKWFVSAEGSAYYQGNLEASVTLMLAWSDSGIITPDTVWNFHIFSQQDYAPAIANPFMDFQVLAGDAKALYIVGDVFDQDTGTSAGASLVVIPKASFESGNTFTYSVFTGILGPSYPQDLQSFFIETTNNFDPNPAFGYLANTPFNYIAAGDLVTFFRIANPGSSNPILSDPILVQVPLYADGNIVNNPFGNAPHAGNLADFRGFLQPGLGGFFCAPHVRDHQLYVAHCTTLDSDGTTDPYGDRLGIRWYQFDMTGDPTGQGKGTETIDTIPALIQVGTLYDPTPIDPLFYYVPAIMTNKNHDLALEGTVSGMTAFTNVFYADRKANDPAGQLRGPFLITNNPGNSYNADLFTPSNLNQGQRWGDESALAPDPSNDLDIWSTGQWAAIPNIIGEQATQLIPTAG